MTAEIERDDARPGERERVRERAAVGVTFEPLGAPREHRMREHGDGARGRATGRLDHRRPERDAARG